MEQFSEGNYIEHWENGIGRIVKIDEGHLFVDFLNRGTIPIEKGKIAHLRKLNPSGLLAQMHQDLEHVQELIKNESTEIIKLLIYDGDKDNNTEIQRSRIKSLLLRAGPNSTGWRRDYGLLENDQWKHWWANVSKKLSKDPWFDTSPKLVIQLREKPVSKESEIYKRFQTENQVEKKLLIIGKLIKVITKESEPLILKTVQDFLTDIIKGKPHPEVIAPCILSAIHLISKGIEVTHFQQNSYELILTTLLYSKLPPAKKIEMFMYFKQLPLYHPFDPIIVSLYGDKQLREAVSKNLTGTRGHFRESKGNASIPALTQLQISAVNRLNSLNNNSLTSSVSDLLELKQSNDIGNFLASALLSESIDSPIKIVISKAVADNKFRDVMYDYFVKMNVPDNSTAEVLANFLQVLRPEDAEWNLRNVLLSESTLRDRPKIALLVLRHLANFSFLDSHQRKRLAAYLADQLPKLNQSEEMELKLEITNVLTDTEELNISPANADLSKIITSRHTTIDKRREALRILIKSASQTEYHSIIRKLINGIQIDEFSLLEDVIESNANMDFAKELFILIVEFADLSQIAVLNAFKQLLKHLGLTRVFLKDILITQDDNWHSKHSMKAKYLLDDEDFARDIVNFAIEGAFFTGQDLPTLKGRLKFYWPKLAGLFLEETDHFVLKSKASFEDSIRTENEKHSEEVKELAAKHKTEIEDVIDKTSQRFEEYLKRLIPILDKLELIGTKLKDSEAEIGKSIKAELLNVATSIREDIEVLLKLLGLIDFEK